MKHKILKFFFLVVVAPWQAMANPHFWHEKAPHKKPFSNYVCMSPLHVADEGYQVSNIKKCYIRRHRKETLKGLKSWPRESRIAKKMIKKLFHLSLYGTEAKTFKSNADSHSMHTLRTISCTQHIYWGLINHQKKIATLQFVFIRFLSGAKRTFQEANCR